MSKTSHSLLTCYRERTDALTYVANLDWSDPLRISKEKAKVEVAIMSSQPTAQRVPVYDVFSVPAGQSLSGG